MKKRRSTVYVRSGKDVTLYIPSDTPPEVIDYLNQLKMEGIFSQGIMDILTRYVREEQSGRRPITELFPGKEMVSDLDETISLADSYSGMESAEPIEPAHEANDNFNQPMKEIPGANDQKKFSLAQIFKQSRHNSGKLVQPSDHGNNNE
ncbi:hypothetical protein [Paenibacillus sp. Soil724D2]|uniref:hypothetical protein n=1 Tax=Paenibacillus sp. (strain Soil724D2) TaxID=1736392 RepID=UPI0007148029|nr:hypothetical protein [Paenibacillus sp. Soil724D2]KRE51418.1 hypothetical protein ASG85_17985 [Paenibacillus sp. Soil724D2]